MPVALLLIKRNATVTLCHSATQNMEQVVREADIVIAAAGQAEMIKVNTGPAWQLSQSAAGIRRVVVMSTPQCSFMYHVKARPRESRKRLLHPTRA
jgi:hypothetical protein